jgi:origin recognition complex subunit 2
LATIAEMFWEQTKLKRKRQSGTRSQPSQTFASQSMDDIISFLNNQTSEDGVDGVCLLIHNIDGPALRDAESQQCLAQVSCCPQIHIVASVDHVNAPLCKLLPHLASSFSNPFIV